MATATEAPASITAEGPTSHTQNQLEALADKVEQLLGQAAGQSGTHGYTRAEQIEALHGLREPFKPEEIRYRPQPWCKACSNSEGWPKVCKRHHEITCQRCKTKITEAHICLKFVGHAEATNRLLNTDPFWDWEPLALDQVGLPQYDGNRGMWIRMTVCGMTRIGYGDAGGKTGANAVKEIIGDAIRNAGMRFGMALDLWTTSDLEIVESGGTSLQPESPTGEATPAPSPGPTPAAEPDRDYLREARTAADEAAVRNIYDEAKGAGVDPEYLAQIARIGQGKAPANGTPDPIDQLMVQVQQHWDDQLGLTSDFAEAKRRGLLARVVQNPLDAWLQFGHMVTARLAELKQQAEKADQVQHDRDRDRSAA